MHDFTIWLRVCYWIGAIADAKAAILLLFPDFLPPLTTAIYGTSVKSNPLRQLCALAIFSWTILLIWADGSPLERKEVLIIGAVLLLGGLSVQRLHKIFSGNHSLNYVLFTVFVVGLALFFVWSYLINTIV